MSMDISPRQKINKEIVVFYDTLGQLDLIDTYRTFHLKTTEYTFFSSPCGMFSRINHMLGHKTSLNKFNSIEIISNIFFSDHSGIKLEINYRGKSRKSTSMCRLVNMLLKKPVGQ